MKAFISYILIVLASNGTQKMSLNPKPATYTIKKQQDDVKQSLPFNDTKDFEEARRGHKANLEPSTITNDAGTVVWDANAYQFLVQDSPDTDNPSLWRQSRLNSMEGLFEVTEGIYQARGLDISNVTFIEGDEGVIVIDPLGSKETGKAALSLYQSYRGQRPIKGMIYTHSHVDHFGGVKGMITEAEVKLRDIPILAPDGFLEHAVSENVYVGIAMGRRAAYMYGAGLSRGPQAQIGSGLGQAASTGEVTLIAPNKIITKTTQPSDPPIIIDGVKMLFQMAPDTEAPSEMLIYFPDFKALCAAEDATHTFHNLLTLRGAVVRDCNSWKKYLTETIDLFGGEATVVFASHHWPTWNTVADPNRVVNFLTGQRDLYAYVHDQTLRQMNQGYTGIEIAEQMVLPPAIDKAWSARGYYGSISHNVKAIYQRYLGWFDGNPAHLWEHIPTERAKRYVDLVGGADVIVTKAKEAFVKGDFRWAVEILNHVIFAGSYHPEARELLADTYEQLGYGAENGTWRNFFLSGTTELRHGNFGTPIESTSSDMITQLTPEMLFDTFAIQVNGPKAWDKNIAIDVVLKDTGERYRWWLSNGALIYTKATQSTNAEVTLTTTSRKLPLLVITGLYPDKLEKEGIEITGDKTALVRLRGLLDPGDPNFAIVTPDDRKADLKFVSLL
jgi:alkyl sulfatase BDS1-like metallo-beta-lactamase superfamily hydrolase